MPDADSCDGVGWSSFMKAFTSGRVQHHSIIYVKESMQFQHIEGEGSIDFPYDVDRNGNLSFLDSPYKHPIFVIGGRRWELYA